MRHRVAHRKLGRVTEHRIAMLRNQALALLRTEHIQTTIPRAKELRPFVERLITIAKRGLTAGSESSRALHARRLVARDLADRTVVSKLFDQVAPRFATRPGGYTRLLRLGYRRGDSAGVAQLELVGSEYNPAAAADKTEKAKEKTAEPKSRSVGSRLRAAAERIRGRKPATAETQETTPSETGGKRAPRQRKTGSTKKPSGGGKDR